MKKMNTCRINFKITNESEAKLSFDYFHKPVIIKYWLVLFCLFVSVSCGTEDHLIEADEFPLEVELPSMEPEDSLTQEPEVPPIEEPEVPPSSQEKFILGMFSADPRNDNTFERLKNAGINYVHTYAKHSPEDDHKYFELASKYDMKVMVNLHARRYVKDSDDNWLSATMRDVKRVKDYSSLGMWYLWDEPSDEMMPNVAKLRQEIAKVSDAPTSLAVEWRTGWTNTRGHSDIWMPDIYPVNGNDDFPNSKLSSYTAFVSSAAQRKSVGAKLIPIMQATDHWSSSNPDKKVRFPNFIEMRFMAFSSLTYGVHGIFFYGYYQSRLGTSQGRSFFNEALTPVLKEINAFDSAVNYPWNLKQNFNLNQRENVNLGYWTRVTGNYMVMTNNSPEVRNLKIDLNKENGFPNGSRKLIPWGSTSQTEATLSEGILSVENVQPWETFIWKVE